MSADTSFTSMRDTLLALSKSPSMYDFFKSAKFPEFASGEIIQIKEHATPSLNFLMESGNMADALSHAPNDIIRKAAQHTLMWTSDTTDIERYEDLYMCMRGLEDIRDNYALFWDLDKDQTLEQSSEKPGVDLLKAFRENVSLSGPSKNADIILALTSIMKSINQVLVKSDIPQEDKTAIHESYNPLQRGRDSMAAIDPQVWNGPAS